MREPCAKAAGDETRIMVPLRGPGPETESDVETFEAVPVSDSPEEVGVMPLGEAKPAPAPVGDVEVLESDLKDGIVLLRRLGVRDPAR